MLSCSPVLYIICLLIFKKNPGLTSADHRIPLIYILSAFVLKVYFLKISDILDPGIAYYKQNVDFFFLSKQQPLSIT